MNQISKVSTETDYTLIKELAKKYGIKVVGQKKTEVVNQINLKLEEENGMKTIENQEVEVVSEGNTEVLSTEVVDQVEETPATEGVTVVENGEESVVDVPAEEGNETEAKGGKWYEQEGTTYTFEEGQNILITGGYEPLIGRYAQITGPSKKRDALKARLYKPNKPSELQGTNVTFNMGDFEVFEGEIPVIENKRAKKSEETQEIPVNAEVAATVEAEPKSEGSESEAV